jgi:transcriptional regulator with XRE-family HTH domain
VAKRFIRQQAAIDGAREVRALAATLGGQAREARRRRRRTIASVARSIGISTPRLSEIERGLGAGAPLTTWVALGIALGRPLAIRFTPPLGEGRNELADAGHLEIQEFLLRLARANGRRGSFELPTRPTDPSRSTDVGVRDAAARVRILHECWNTIGDLGAAVRATHRKHAEAVATWPDDRIATVWVVRATAANRQLLTRYPHIVAASFPGSSRAWVRALTTGTAPPIAPGLVWFDPATRRLTEWRRGALPSAP